MSKPFCQRSAEITSFLLGILFAVFHYFYSKNQFGWSSFFFARQPDPNKITPNPIKVNGKMKKYTHQADPRMKSLKFESAEDASNIRKTM